jgi:transposase
LLILGARSVLQSGKKKEDAISRWTRDVESRRGYWKAVVAMAAKNAQLAWAVLRRGEDFRLYGQEVPAGRSACSRTARRCRRGVAPVPAEPEG